MTILRKQIVSEKTIILWLVLTVASSMACILIAGLLVYLIYDCWPIGRSLTGENACLSKIQPDILHFLPMILGILIGTVLTRIIIKR